MRNEREGEECVRVKRERENGEMERRTAAERCRRGKRAKEGRTRLVQHRQERHGRSDLFHDVSDLRLNCFLRLGFGWRRGSIRQKTRAKRSAQRETNERRRWEERESEMSSTQDSRLSFRNSFVPFHLDVELPSFYGLSGVFGHDGEDETGDGAGHEPG